MFSIVLVLLGLLLCLLLLWAVTVQHDQQNYQGDRWADDHPKPSRWLEFVECGLGLLISLLIEEASKCEAVHVSAKYTCLKVGAATDNKLGCTSAVVLLQLWEINCDRACSLALLIYHHICRERLFVRKVFHVAEVKADFSRYILLIVLNLRAGAHLSLSVHNWLRNHITVWVSNRSIISHID